VIVAPESAETLATAPVGTGPFRFARWVQGDRVELERNADYWGEAPALERATFKFISDPTAAFAAMMAGDVDAFPVFPAPENLGQFEADPRFRVIVGTTEGETILAMNHACRSSTTSGAPGDRHAIDRQAIIDGAMFGYGTPIGTPFRAASSGLCRSDWPVGLRPREGAALLAEAGAEGLTTTLKLPPPTYARRGGEIIAAQLRAVGIETEIENLEWAQWLEQVFTARTST
jgi:peptide/nickel transport system substrate-binding protein